MKDFRNLIVWQKAHELVLEIYTTTKNWPKEETYGLTSQIRRASSSIPTNIAEGCGRNTDGDTNRFFQFAMGSASEVEYLIILGKELEYLSPKEYTLLNDRIVEIKKMLASLIKKLITNR
jgi:four helix bundle protein